MGEDSWAEALTWHNTFREGQEKDLTTALAREWQHWYANAENRRTFENVTRLLADRRVYHKRNRPSRAELEADRYDVSIPVAEWRKTHTPGKKGSLPRHWWRSVSGRIAVAAAAAIAVLVFGWSLWLLSEASLSDHIVYQTRAGQVKDIQLRDGSSIILGAQTELSVDFSRQIRSVKLLCTTRIGHLWLLPVTVPSETSGPPSW
jgi:ferric-dicitrate binding protein FerR (iron transport regulator)